VRHYSALQETPVPREDDTPLLPRRVRQGLIVKAPCEGRVEAEHAQQSRELPQVHIDDEPRFPKGDGPYFGGALDVPALEDRVHADPVTVQEPVPEVH